MSSAGGPVIITFESELAAARRSYEAFVAEVTKPLTVPMTAASGTGAGSTAGGGAPGSGFDLKASAKDLDTFNSLYRAFKQNIEADKIKIKLDTIGAEADLARIESRIAGLRGGGVGPSSTPPSSPLGPSGGGGPFWWRWRTSVYGPAAAYSCITISGGARADR